MLHLMNAYLNSHLLNYYIKKTSPTNCEIKMYTGLLPKNENKYYFNDMV